LETARIAEVQDKHEAELMALPNVAGVATSMKVKAYSSKVMMALK
jgi:hypothetical protein